MMISINQIKKVTQNVTVEDHLKKFTNAEYVKGVVFVSSKAEIYKDLGSYLDAVDVTDQHTVTVSRCSISTAR